MSIDFPSPSILMTRSRLGFGLFAALALIATGIAVRPGQAQFNFRGGPTNAPTPPPSMPPNPGFSGISGGFSGNPTGISGNFSGNPTGISGGFSGISGRTIEIPTIVTVWSCLRCGREVSRGNFPPHGPCPHCNNTGNPNQSGLPMNPGSWNNNPVTPPNSNPQPSQPIYPPANPTVTRSPDPSREGGTIEPSPGGFFSSSSSELPKVQSPWTPAPASTPPPTDSSNRDESSSGSRVIVVLVILLVILGIAATVLILIARSRKPRYEYRSSKRRRPASSRRRYRHDEDD